MRYLFSLTFPNTVTDGRYEPYEFPLFSSNWFTFYFERWKCRYQRFIITSHVPNFTRLAGRLGQSTLYSGISLCVKVMKETAGINLPTSVKLYNKITLRQSLRLYSASMISNALLSN